MPRWWLVQPLKPPKSSSPILLCLHIGNITAEFVILSNQSSSPLMESKLFRLNIQKYSVSVLLCYYIIPHPWLCDWHIYLLHVLDLGFSLFTLPSIFSHHCGICLCPLTNCYQAGSPCLCFIFPNPRSPFAPFSKKKCCKVLVDRFRFARKSVISVLALELDLLVRLALGRSLSVFDRLSFLFDPYLITSI